MGSFNEICALSGLEISPGTKVKLLFLTRNPYIDSDQHDAQRGNYHYDQWFLRTPPIQGTYDDYGQCTFRKNPITTLITKLFEKDIVERPFGFNQYHAADVTKSKGIYHFLQAAFQGRLLVGDDYKKDKRQIPENFPTWEKIHSYLKKKKLPIQLESRISEGGEGFNAQPVRRGIVCVTWNSYSDEEDNLKIAEGVLSQYYDCKIVYEIPKDKYQPCLMVVPKGGFKDPNIISSDDNIAAISVTHPSRNPYEDRQLPVLSIMVREDVWNTYCSINSRDTRSVEFYQQAIESVALKQTERKAQDLGIDFGFLVEGDFRRYFFSLPFQTTVLTHLVSSFETKMSDKAKTDLFRACAEATRVEQILSDLRQSWQIPTLGGQSYPWDLKKQLSSEIAAICEKELQKEEQEREDWD